MGLIKSLKVQVPEASAHSVMVDRIVLSYPSGMFHYYIITVLTPISN